METIYNHFRNAEFEGGDNRDLSFRVDGQVAHAIKRLIGNLVRDCAPRTPKESQFRNILAIINHHKLISMFDLNKVIQETTINFFIVKKT